MFFFEHYYMNVCAKFTSDKTDDVTSDPPGGSEVGSGPARKTDDVTSDPPDDVTSDPPERPLEGESYWIFVWTLGGGGARWKGSRTWFLYGLWGRGAPGRWIDGSMDLSGLSGLLDPSIHRAIDPLIYLSIYQSDPPGPADDGRGQAVVRLWSVRGRIVVVVGSWLAPGLADSTRLQIGVVGVAGLWST